MFKFPYKTLAITLLLTSAALVVSGGLAAQETIRHSEPQATQPTATDPIEIATAFPAAPNPPAPNTGSARSEAIGFAPAPIVGVSVASPEPVEHRFWDRENRILFAVAGGFAAADFCVTRRNLDSGGRELNPVTRILSGSTPGLAANFALETSGVIAVGYLFHKTGHHKLERMTSFLNISGSAGAVAFGLSHP